MSRFPKSINYIAKKELSFNKYIFQITPLLCADNNGKLLTEKWTLHLDDMVKLTFLAINVYGNVNLDGKLDSCGVGCPSKAFSFHWKKLFWKVFWTLSRNLLNKIKWIWIWIGQSCPTKTDIFSQTVRKIENTINIFEKLPLHNHDK